MPGETRGLPTDSECAAGSRVSILIASLGRPSLLRTLDSIQRAAVPAGCSVEIIIADDGPHRRVPDLLNGYESVLPIRVLDVAARNVSVARNALLDAAAGDWIIFVDDDEHVDREWIAGHLSAAREFGADAVFGPAYFVYPETSPEWFRRADPMWKDLGWSQDGKRVDTGRTTNTLVRVAKIRELGMRFDPKFGRTGGGDDDFFRRMNAAGAKLVLTNRAKTWEDVPETRATPAYMLERSMRNGQTYAAMQLADRSAAGRAVFALDATIKLLVAGSAAIFSRPVNRAWSHRFGNMAWSNIGKLRAVIGAATGDGWANEAGG